MGKTSKKNSSSVVLLLIILSGDCERNPGPVRFPCGTCRRAVAKNHRAVCCDSCQNWFHIKCCNITANQYKDIQSNPIDEDWFCTKCKANNECPICESMVKNADPGICCDHCNKWYHSSCTCSFIPTIYETPESWITCFMVLSHLRTTQFFGLILQ